MKDEYRPKQKKNVISKDKKDGGLVFDIVKGELYELNETAYRIWGLCDGKSSVRAIEEKLSGEYEISGEDGRLVEKYVQEMKALGLVE